MKHFVYQTKAQLEGLRWMARVVEFGVSLSFTVAIHMLYIGHLALREDKDMFRREAKKYANEAIRRADIKKARVMAAMKDYRFYDAYSDLAIDLSENLMTMLRFNVKQELDKARHPKANAMADIESARIMLFLAKQQYDSVIGEGRDKWHLPKQILYQWGEFDLCDVFNSWELAVDTIYQTTYQGISIDMNTPNILAVVDKIGHAFGDGEYIEECLKAAKAERPGFFNDFIIVE